MTLSDLFAKQRQKNGLPAPVINKAAIYRTDLLNTYNVGRYEEGIEGLENEPTSIAYSVEEIHNAFMTNVDSMVRDAVQENERLCRDESSLRNGERLAKLGFSIAHETQKTNNARFRKRVNESLIDAVSYFAMKYPNYKLITRRGIDRLIKKYSLALGPIQFYIGQVPEKNISEMENFKISDDDRAYQWISGRNETPGIQHSSFHDKDGNSGDWLYHKCGDETLKKASFVIAAPLDHFKTNTYVNSNGEVVELKDPIVMQPVMHNKECYYLIVTAWGPEAKDEAVVNQKMN